MEVGRWEREGERISVLYPATTPIGTINGLSGKWHYDRQKPGKQQPSEAQQRQHYGPTA